ncbi:hypothetical protein HPB49_023971 [Dermacentor silvarum]|uniref:Uncharacterized protein n=1 Tax=Dermacentor silvarum TaxID=543639 RepID=A0ACB8E473_DERSI|nr:hypothetical protein HPB49_023971 [Dermacentor silvarum]
MTTKADLVVTFHFMKGLTRKLGSILRVPPTAKSKRELGEFLDGVQKWDSQLESTTQKSEEIFKAISFLLDKLSDTTTEERVCTLQFIREQLKLLPMSKVRRRYSAEFMVFCCLFFTISPHAYKYVRSYGNVILPHPMTIRSICSSYGTIPQLEHENSAFLKYMATRISDLDDYQRSVTLMVDDIHIKAFFDYK